MPGPDEVRSLVGRLLVASPVLGDSNFERSVVLVLDHDEDGALGVVINRPTEVEVSAVLPVWQPLASEPGVLFQGGPVALDSALALALVPGADDDEEPLGWRRVVDRIGLVDLDVPPEVLAAEISRLRVFAGYSGWAAGQLEDELAEGAWYVVPARLGWDGDGGDPFSMSPGDLWPRVLRRQGGDLALVSTYLADPSLN